METLRTAASPRGKFRSNAFSPARLARMHDFLRRTIDSGRVPGLVTGAWRHGETRVDPMGAIAYGGKPMPRDAIFRIASMTKPITAVAAMMLVESCTLRLDDPI